MYSTHTHTHTHTRAKINFFVSLPAVLVAVSNCQLLWQRTHIRLRYIHVMARRVPRNSNAVFSRELQFTYHYTKLFSSALFIFREAGRSATCQNSNYSFHILLNSEALCL